MIFTNYIVLDMEWSQPSGGHTRESNGICLHGEIIQIGAVKLDENYNMVDTFQMDIRPVVYKMINKKIERITNISTESAKEGFLGSYAFKMFRKWCDEDFSFLTWGSDDVKILRDNLMFFGYPNSWLPKENYDVQPVFDFMTHKMGRQFSLDFAMEYYGIEEDRPRHNAMNDAYYTALVCREMHPENLKENYREIMRLEFKIPGVCEKEGIVKEIEVLDGNEPRPAAEKMLCRNVKCPKCGNEASLMKKFHKGEMKYATMHRCKKHGSFVSMMRLRPIEDFKMMKIICDTYVPGSEEGKSLKAKLKGWEKINDAV